MNIFDIVVLTVFVISVVICFWKGFLKTVLKLGASFLAALGAGIFGRPVGKLLLPELIKKQPSGMSAGALERLNGAISSIAGTLLVFIVLFVIFKLLAGLLAKIAKKITGTSVLDRTLGAVFGLFIAFASTAVLAVVLQIIAAIGTFIYPDFALFELMEDSVLFKYFI